MSNYVYILASKRNGTLYIGVTSDIERRLFEHKNKTQKSFTSRYNITRLVYLEQHDSITEAIEHEKQLKSWTRARKITLIETLNPSWRDLTQELDL